MCNCVRDNISLNSHAPPMFHTHKYMGLCKKNKMFIKLCTLLIICLGLLQTGLLCRPCDAAWTVFTKINKEAFSKNCFVKKRVHGASKAPKTSEQNERRPSEEARGARGPATLRIEREGAAFPEAPPLASKHAYTRPSPFGGFYC